MPTAMPAAAAPLVIEIDPATWQTHVDRVVPWLATTATLQTAFRELVERTLADLTEPVLRGYLMAIRDAARDHEAKVADLYRAFGREPPAAAGVLHAVAATVVSGTRRLAGRIEGLVGGSHGAAWHDLRELLLTNLDTISGFGVAEQLALALGLPAAAQICLPILVEKTRHQLQLRESFLEMAPVAILYHQDV